MGQAADQFQRVAGRYGVNSLNWWAMFTWIIGYVFGRVTGHIKGWDDRKAFVKESKEYWAGNRPKYPAAKWW